MSHGKETLRPLIPLVGRGRRPRVLYVTAWLPTPTAPTMGIFVERDIRALAHIADIHVMHLVAPHLWGEEHARDTWKVPGGRVTIERIVTTPTNPVSLLSAGRALARRIAAADLVHTATPPPVLALAATPLPVPWVHTDHWSGYADVSPRDKDVAANGKTRPPARAVVAPSPGLGRRLTLAVLGRLMRRVDVLVGVSPTLTAQLAHLSGREAVTVPNIVDMELCEPRPHDDPLGTPDRPLRLISVANAVEGKRPLLAADTCAELMTRGRAVELTWVGEGPLLDDLRARAHDLEVELQTPGALPPQGVREALARSDLFVLPTAWESFCLAAAEALSAGRPVVMGDRGGQGAFVVPPSGALVAGQTPADYADAIEKVLAATAGMSATQIASDVQERYSVQAFLKRYRQIYASVLPEGFLLDFPSEECVPPVSEA